VGAVTALSHKNLPGVAERPVWLIAGVAVSQGPSHTASAAVRLARLGLGKKTREVARTEKLASPKQNTSPPPRNTERHHAVNEISNDTTRRGNRHALA
jgi:hypothetical protein